MSSVSQCETFRRKERAWETAKEHMQAQHDGFVEMLQQSREFELQKLAGVELDQMRKSLDASRLRERELESQLQKCQQSITALKQELHETSARSAVSQEKAARTRESMAANIKFL